MAKKGSFSKVYDKNGDYADVEAVRFDGTRTFQMQGDVTASQTWNGDHSSPLTLNASIGAKKVTQDKIGDKAVGSVQMADGSVGLTQMDPNAMTSSATSGDTRLITAGGVRTEIDNAILNRGKDYGPMTPTQINAISETIPTGSTVHVTAAGTITDGDIEVRQGEDLKYYRSGNTHYWYSMDGDFKLKQQAKTSPSASGDALSFIDSITQDENGEISATKKTVQDGTTSQKGVVQLEDSYSSTSTTKAATPNSVKSAYDLANTANTGLANKLDKTGDGEDVTVSFSEASTRENIGTGEKLSVMFGKIKKWFTDLGTAAFKNVPASGNASNTEVVLGSDTRLSAGASAIQGVKVNNTTLMPDANKVVTVPLATTSADGAMSAADKTKLNGIAAGAEANVQSDWEQTSSDSDDYIKNKPFRRMYYTASQYRVVAKVLSSWEIQFCSRAGDSITETGTVSGFDDGDAKLFIFGGSSSANKMPNFHLIKNQDTGDILLIVQIKSYMQIKVFNPYRKQDTDLSVFDTEVPSWATPSDANKITPVWVANSASSSGTAPVKVDEYGALTPVPMDSTPTESSTNLVTSGAIKTALDGKQDKPSSATEDNIATFNGTKSTKDSGKSFLPSTSTWDGTSDAKVPTAKAVQAKLDGKVDSYKIVGASLSSADTQSHNWQKLLDIKLRGWSRFSAILFSNLDDTVPSGFIVLSISRLADGIGAPTNISVDTFGRTEQNPTLRKWAYSYDSVSNSTIVYTHSRFISNPEFRLLYNYNSNPQVVINWFSSSDSTSIPESSTEFNAYEHVKHTKGYIIGSASVPVYVQMDGRAVACTDDFVHDGDVAQTYSSTSEAPISGKGVAEKNDLHAIRLTSSDDLNSIANTSSAGTLQVYNWLDSSKPSNYPENVTATMIQYGIANTTTSKNCIQVVYPRIAAYYYTRLCSAGIWTPWTKVYYEATSTFSSTGTAPVNGTAVAEALATSLTDVAYVANQSGGGGNLNKTINGTTTSVLTFMTDSEAVAIWADAKTAAANAS